MKYHLIIFAFAAFTSGIRLKKKKKTTTTNMGVKELIPVFCYKSDGLGSHISWSSPVLLEAGAIILVLQLMKLKHRKIHVYIFY